MWTHGLLKNSAKWSCKQIFFVIYFNEAEISVNENIFCVCTYVRRLVFCHKSTSNTEGFAF